MSDIQDLIHKTTMDCLERGRREERQRLIKLFEEAAGSETWADDIIALLEQEKAK